MYNFCLLQFAEFLRLTNKLQLPEVDFEDPENTIDSKILEAFITVRNGDGIKAKKILEEINWNLDEMNQFALNTINAYTLWQTSQNEEMFKIVKGNLENAKSSESPFFKYFRAMNLHLMGNYYWDDGKLPRSLKYFSESLELKNELNDYLGSADTMTNITQIYLDLGNADKSLEYLSQAKQAYSRIKSDLGLNYVKIFQCDLERRFGNFESALITAQETAAYFKETPSSIYYAISLHELGTCLRRLGRYEEAKDQLEKSIQIKKHTQNYFELLHGYLELAYLLIDMDENEELNNLLEEIKTLPTVERIAYLEIQRKLIEAIILKSKPNLSSKVKAQTFLEEIIMDPNIEYHQMLKFAALVNLLEINILELKVSPNQEILEKIRFYVSILEKLGEKTSIPTISISCEIIKGNFEVVNGHLDIALAILQNALEKANERNIQHLVTQINNDIAQITDLIGIWERFLSSEYSEKFKLIDLQNYLREVSQNLDTRKY